MATFEAAIPVILVHEGGNANLRGDSGGKTHFGISSAFCAKANIPLPSTQQEAIAIYQKYFWLAIYSKINDQTIATKVFDDHVNQGEVATRNLQTALNQCGSVSPGEMDEIPVTNYFGPITLAATNHADPQRLIHSFQIIQRDEYTAWVRKDKERVGLLNGLWNRAAWPNTQVELGWNGVQMASQIEQEFAEAPAASDS